jgi:hypothetical protein
MLENVDATTVMVDGDAMTQDVTFILGRDRIRGEHLHDHLTDGSIRRVGDRVRKAALSVRCPIHGKPLENIEILLDASGGDGIRVDMAPPCCERLNEALTRAVMS